MLIINIVNKDKMTNLICANRLLTIRPCEGGYTDVYGVVKKYEQWVTIARETEMDGLRVIDTDNTSYKIFKNEQYD